MSGITDALKKNAHDQNEQTILQGILSQQQTAKNTDPMCLEHPAGKYSDIK